MSNIQSLVLNVEQLLNQYKALQQENTQLKTQVSQLEQALAAAEHKASAGLSPQDIDSLQRLNAMLDGHLSNNN